MKLPRFTIRDLFWLMLVVAMGCAWWMDQRQIHGRYENLIDAVGRDGGKVVEREGGHVIYWGRPSSKWD